MSILLLHSKNLSRRRHLERVRDYAAEHGERVLLVMKDPTWEADYASRVAVAETASLEATVQVVDELAAGEREPIRAVVTFAERLVPAAARAATLLQLPYVSEETARIARDKCAMRRALDCVPDVSQPRFGMARTLDEALTEADRIGYPVIAKPVAGTGSIYVRRIDDAGDLTRHFAGLRDGSRESSRSDPLCAALDREHGSGLLLEEFVPGTEVCVESLVSAGRTTVLAIHDKPLPTGPTFEEVYACTPSRLPPEQVAAVHAATAAVHRGMGIDTGPTHVELRLPWGRGPVVLEAAARMGGGPIYRSVQLSTGVDMVAATLDLAAGRVPRISPRPDPRPVGFWNMFSRKAGTLVSVKGVEIAESDPRVDEVAIYRALGEYLRVPPDTYQGHGHLIFVVESVGDLDEAFDQMVATVRMETA